MKIRAAPSTAGQVVLAMMLGSAIALVFGLTLTVIDAVARRSSPAGPSEGGVVVLFLLVALIYGAVAGMLVGVAGAVLLPRRGRVPPRRRTAFVVASCVIAAAAIGGLVTLIDIDGPLLVVPAALVVPALVTYLRRYAPR